MAETPQEIISGIQASFSTAQEQELGEDKFGLRKRVFDLFKSLFQEKHIQGYTSLVNRHTTGISFITADDVRVNIVCGTTKKNFPSIEYSYHTSHDHNLSGEPSSGISSHISRIREHSRLENDRYYRGGNGSKVTVFNEDEIDFVLEDMARFIITLPESAKPTKIRTDCIGRSSQAKYYRPPAI